MGWRVDVAIGRGAAGRVGGLVGEEFAEVIYLSVREIVGGTRMQIYRCSCERDGNCRAERSL